MSTLRNRRKIFIANENLEGEDTIAMSGVEVDDNIEAIVENNEAATEVSDMADQLGQASDDSETLYNLAEELGTAAGEEGEGPSKLALIGINAATEHIAVTHGLPRHTFRIGRVVGKEANELVVSKNQASEEAKGLKEKALAFLKGIWSFLVRVFEKIKGYFGSFKARIQNVGKKVSNNIAALKEYFGVYNHEGLKITDTTGIMDAIYGKVVPAPKLAEAMSDSKVYFDQPFVSVKDLGSAVGLCMTGKDELPVFDLETHLPAGYGWAEKAGQDGVGVLKFTGYFKDAAPAIRTNTLKFKDIFNTENIVFGLDKTVPDLEQTEIDALPMDILKSISSADAARLKTLTKIAQIPYEDQIDSILKDITKFQNSAPTTITPEMRRGIQNTVKIVSGSLAVTSAGFAWEVNRISAGENYVAACIAASKKAQGDRKEARSAANDAAKAASKAAKA